MLSGPLGCLDIYLFFLFFFRGEKLFKWVGKAQTSFCVSDPNPSRCSHFCCPIHLCRGSSFALVPWLLEGAIFSFVASELQLSINRQASIALVRVSRQGRDHTPAKPEADGGCQCVTGTRRPQTCHCRRQLLSSPHACPTHSHRCKPETG